MGDLASKLGDQIGNGPKLSGELSDIAKNIPETPSCSDGQQYDESAKGCVNIVETTKSGDSTVLCKEGTVLDTKTNTCVAELAASTPDGRPTGCSMLPCTSSGILEVLMLINGIAGIAALKIIRRKDRRKD